MPIPALLPVPFGKGCVGNPIASRGLGTGVGRPRASWAGDLGVTLARSNNINVTEKHLVGSRLFRSWATFEKAHLK